jgi:hypothetical protein
MHQCLPQVEFYTTADGLNGINYSLARFINP